MPDETLTYAASGVNIDEAALSLRTVLPQIKATYNEQVVAGVGGFGGLFRASFPGIGRPLLVTSIDGVGTKTKVAAMAGQFGGIGFDIVNHCVNDILCQGGRPLFFLDYFGTSRLSPAVFEQVISGAAQACEAVGAVLIGGETAEMPGVYHDDEVDVVGAIVGVVEEDKKLPRGLVQAGDLVIGVASDGLHTNGFTLARRALFEMGGFSVRDPMPGLTTSICDELLRPHRCYFGAVHPLLDSIQDIHAVAHITGGGLYDNIPRVLPSDLQCIIERRSWLTPAIFDLIQSAGNVPDTEMFRTFNMGVGMVLVVAKDSAPEVVRALTDAGESAVVIGALQRGTRDVQIV